MAFLFLCSAEKDGDQEEGSVDNLFYLFQDPLDVSPEISHHLAHIFQSFSKVNPEIYPSFPKSLQLFQSEKALAHLCSGNIDDLVKSSVLLRYLQSSLVRSSTLICVPLSSLVRSSPLICVPLNSYFKSLSNRIEKSEFIEKKIIFLFFPLYQ